MHKRYILIAALLWAASVQYFVVQISIAVASRHYNFISDAISDLGNTGCGRFDGHYVCSAYPWLMNDSLIALGASVLAGALLFLAFYRPYRLRTRLGFVLMGVASIGIIMVGLFPENLAPTIHNAGADLGFLAGLMSIVIIGIGLKVTKWLHYYTIAAALIAATGLILITTHNEDWVASGAAERAVASSEIIWLILFGVYIAFRLLRRPTLELPLERKDEPNIFQI